jgi:hypothetical protein
MGRILLMNRTQQHQGSKHPSLYILYAVLDFLILGDFSKGIVFSYGTHQA